MTSMNIANLRNCGNMSRYQIVDWVNRRVGRNTFIERVEDLCTGVAYCFLTEMMAPNMIDMSQVDMRPVGTCAYEHNLGILQDAFNNLQITQSVPIQLLIRGRFKYNLEFFQYFKKLYDSLRSKRRASKPKPTVAKVVPIKRETKPKPEVEDDPDNSKIGMRRQDAFLIINSDSDSQRQWKAYRNS